MYLGKWLGHLLFGKVCNKNVLMSIVLNGVDMSKRKYGYYYGYGGGYGRYGRYGYGKYGYGRYGQYGYGSEPSKK